MDEVLGFLRAGSPYGIALSIIGALFGALRKKWLVMGFTYDEVLTRCTRNEAKNEELADKWLDAERRAAIAIAAAQKQQEPRT